MNETLERQKEHILDLETDNGDQYRGRLTGVELCDDERNAVYLTDDERVILYDSHKSKMWELEDPEEDLRDVLASDDYVRVLGALGIKPVVDL